MIFLDNKDYIMWLSKSLYFNSKKVYYLLDIFGCAENVFNAERKELSDLKILKSENIDLMFKNKDKIPLWKSDLDRIGAEYITFEEEKYPQKLKNMYSPPVGIYVKGNFIEKMPSVAIIGSRRCTAYGSETAKMFSRELSEKGVCIISGMAAGIDSVANQVALKTGGYTVAVLGFGFNFCYPYENRKLMDNIAEKGCLISEYSPDTKPEVYYFPRRNELIAALSDVVVIVEAGKKSGALITADAACQYGREVMAVPSNITSLNGKGVNELIRDGCAVALDTEDIIFSLKNISYNFEENIGNERQKDYKPRGENAKKEQSEKQTGIAKEENLSKIKKTAVELGLTSFAEEIYNLLGFEPVSTDYIAAKTKFSAAEIQSGLAMLEIYGIIEKLPGDRFVIK